MRQNRLARTFSRQLIGQLLSVIQAINEQIIFRLLAGMNRRKAKSHGSNSLRKYVARLEERRLLASVPYGAQPQDGSEFMLGDVYVTVVFLESDGTIDDDLNDWSAEQKTAVKQKIVDGLDWWENLLDLQQSEHDLNFVVDFTYADSPVNIPYEPLTRPGTDEQLWIESFLSSVGYDTGSDFRDELDQFNHDQRVRHSTHWAFTMFITDSDADPDGLYADEANAWASFRGRTVIQSHRDAATVAHEVGHVFYNLDEYPGGGDFSDRRGYYNTQNLNAFENHPNPSTRVPSLMAESRQLAWASNTSSPSSLEMIGWKDSDGDGIFDVLDVQLSMSAAAAFNATSDSLRVVGHSWVNALSNQNPIGAGNDISINTVGRLEYRLDDGVWQTAAELSGYEAHFDATIDTAQSTFDRLELRTVSPESGSSSNVLVVDSGSAAFGGDYSVAGFAWHDSLPDGIWESQETPLSGVALTLIDGNGEVAVQTAVVEPDEYDHREVVTELGVGWVLTAVGEDVSDPRTVAWDVANGTTGTKVFAHRLNTGHWNTTWRQSRRLRVDFLSEVNEVYLDVASPFNGGEATLNAYSADGTLLDSFTTARLDEGETETMAVSAEGISYVITDGNPMRSSVRFDNLRFGTSARATTGPLGHYRFNAIPEGQYSLAIVEPPGGHLTSTPQSQLPVDLTNGQSQRLDFGIALPGLLVEQSSGATSVVEAGDDEQILLRLAAKPAQPVIVKVDVNNLAVLTHSPSAVTFTTDNWMTPQTISVRANDNDTIDDIRNGVLYLTVDQTSDIHYNNISMEIEVSIIDDDTAGIVITESGGSTSVSEDGDNDSFDIALTAQPMTNVVLTVSNDNTEQLVASATEFTFTPETWSSPQRLNLTAVDDSIVDGDVATTLNIAVVPALSDDAFDSAPPQSVTVTVEDNDRAGFLVQESQASTSVSESGTGDTLSVRLSARPATDVVLTVSASDTSEVSTTPSSLTFTPQNWNALRTITVNGVDDPTVDGDVASAIVIEVNPLLSQDEFDALPAQQIPVTTIDDDAAGFSVEESEGITAVTEAGGSDSFTVVLDAQPLSDVVFDVNNQNTAEISANKQSLTFTPSNWHQPQVVAVSAVDDHVIDSTQTTLISIVVRQSETDDAFDLLPAQTVSVNSTDNDVAGFLVTETQGQTTVSESGQTDEFSLILTAEPQSDVVLTLAHSSPDEVSLNKDSVRFTSENWDSPQTITVTGTDDDLLDGPQLTTIHVTVSVDDSDDDFDSVVPQSVIVETTDDDVAGLFISPSAITVSEDGSQQNVAVRLTAAPSADVVVSVVTADNTEAVPHTSTLTFTPETWDDLQTVTITGVDDEIVDGNQDVDFTFAIFDEASDAAFHEVADRVVTVTNNDDDEVGFRLSKTTAEVSETGTTDTFTVVLLTSPSSDVVINVARQRSGEVTESPYTLTFQPGNWDVPQVVTLRGLDDTETDGDQETDIHVSVNALLSDDAWDGLPLQVVKVTTVDDDVAYPLPEITAPVGASSPGEPITIEWQRTIGALSYELWLEEIGGESNPLVHTTVSALSFTIEDGLGFGRYRAWVRAHRSDGFTQWAIGEFEVDAAPVLTPLPFHGIDATPMISWNAVSGATSYRLYVSNVTTEQAGLVDVIVEGTEYEVPSAFGFGIHRIWVRAVGRSAFAGTWSTAENYYIGPTLISPVGPAFEDQPTFEWSTMPDIDSVQLYVQKGSTVVLNESGLPGTSHQIASPLEPGDYRWWIRPFTAGGRAGAWSTVGEFNVGGRTRIVSPVGSTSDGLATISWQRVPDAGFYEIYLFNDDGIGLVHREQGLVDTSFQAPPMPDGNYRVWLRSYRQDGSAGPWSRAHGFVLEAATQNLIATPLSPVAPTLDPNPIFRWTAVAGAAAYELYLTDGTDVITVSDLTASEWSPAAPLNTGTWKWWVRAKNEVGYGPWSPAASADLTGRVVILAPIGSTSNRRPTFSWTEVAEADRYSLVLDNLTTGTNSYLRRDNLTANTFTPDADLDAGDYRVWLRAIRTSDNTFAPWSFSQEFSVVESNTGFAEGMMISVDATPRIEAEVSCEWTGQPAVSETRHSENAGEGPSFTGEGNSQPTRSRLTRPRQPVKTNDPAVDGFDPKEIDALLMARMDLLDTIGQSANRPSALVKRPDSSSEDL